MAAPSSPPPADENHERLLRIDQNLQIMRDKIDDAERLPGQTRSDLLIKLNGDDKPRIPGQSFGDMLGTQKLASRRDFQFLLG